MWQEMLILIYFNFYVCIMCIYTSVYHVYIYVSMCICMYGGYVCECMWVYMLEVAYIAYTVGVLMALSTVFFYILVDEWMH